MKPTFQHGRTFPYIQNRAPNQSAAAENLEFFCCDKREQLKEKLLSAGSILFRGWEVQNPSEFAQIIKAFSGKSPLSYAGGVSPRIELGYGIYTSTEYPSDMSLSVHNEMSYSPNYPSEVYFCCVVPPGAGGETPIASSRKILELLDPEIVEKFKQRRIMYERNLSGIPGDAYSWKAAFETEDKAEVERRCSQLEIEFKWDSSAGLSLRQLGPATVTHKATGEEVWFNQAEGFHHSAAGYKFCESQRHIKPRLDARFSDGGEIDIAVLEEIRRVSAAAAGAFAWHKGDVLVLDNVLTAHGRAPFTGSRRIILGMT
jgi:alpha-ketoglutarate-dependent taurine dioxygenase